MNRKSLLLLMALIGCFSYGSAQTYNFTNAGATGRFGPTQAQVNTEYSATNLNGAVTVTTQGIQEWVVPTSGTYTITAVGACGGELQGTYYPGLPGTGATIEGDFFLSAGTTVYVVVGQKGMYGDNGSGGGGGSFAYTGAPGGAGLMVAAGGGGGHGHGSGAVATGAHGGGGSVTTAAVNGAYGTGNGGSGGIGQGGLPGIGCSYQGHGAGGAGWLSNGSDATCGLATGGNATTFVGGDGGADLLHGGFGGGGGSDGNGSPGGGGGGYTGGGGGNDYNGSSWGAGAGAGSYNNGTNQTNTAGITGAASGYTHGSVTISLNCIPTWMTLDNATLPTITEDCISSPTPPTATNDCGTVNATPDVVLPITFIGTTTITWTFDDGVTQLTQTQDVVLTGDVTPPVLDNATLPNYQSQCEFTSLPVPTATDLCSGSVDGVPDVTFPITTQGNTTITWTFTDGGGNSVTQTQTVTLADVAAPQFDVASLPDYVGCNSATPPTATATDNCAGALNGTPDVAFPITTLGTTVVTWTYDDGNGNTSSQTQNVIVSTVDNGVTLNATTLTANASNITYQWMDCATGQPIAGETNQSYTPTVTGNYAVIVTDMGCSDTSSCELVDFTGIEDLTPTIFTMFPNPNSGQFTINFETEETYAITIQDIAGKVVFENSNVSNDNNLIEVEGLATGSYYVTIKNDTSRSTRKMVIH